jgi:cytochrome c-type biogenesis protein
MELTLAAAIVAGLISFLSPCVLPVVPAYLGQLGALAVATRPSFAGEGAVATVPDSRLARRWAVLPHALAFVLGFTLVFTLLGLTIYVGRSLNVDLPLLRQIGGIVLIVLGLQLAGVLRLRRLAWSWRPLDRWWAGRRAADSTPSPLGAFTLGAVFSLGWTPCIGPTLGAILGLAALGPSAQVVALFVAYSIGLAVPFVAVAMALDRAPALIRPLLRYGRTVEIVGGALVVAIGVLILFDGLYLIASRFSFLWPQV